MTAAPTDNPTPPPPAGIARLTVLLGDEATSAAEAWHQTARGLLANQGVETLVAHTGPEALSLLEAGVLGKGRRIHVAVLDQGMPTMSGIQILRRLRQDTGDAVGLPPAILLADPTARGLSGAFMHEALTARAFSVLPKPIQLDLLLDTLARALRRHYQNKWPEGGPTPPDKP